MSDIIRREDAIDALKKYEELESNNFSDTSPIGMMTVATIANCIEEIVNLPSAEPERWTPVSEALPEEKGEYLVSYHPCHWNAVSEKVAVGIDTFRGKTTWAKKKYQKVIAWMSMPEPYEGD